MSVTRRAVLAGLGTLPLVSCSMTDPTQKKIDSLIARYAGDVPGAAVAIVRAGTPTTIVAGLATLGPAAERITSATNFRLASLTKQFTAAAILLLMEDGKLDLSDRVRQWLPSLPAAADAITLRHLLTHTSGLIDYEDVIPLSMTGQLHDQDVLTILGTQEHLYFEPGTNYRYSNSAYALLALIVGKVSGISFAQFLAARIFRPLGMTNSVAFEDGISTIAHRAFGHTEEQSVWKQTDQSQTSAVLGDGGIYSSLDDLVKWDAALYDERLLKKSSLDSALTPATRTDDPNVEYGYGWRITGETLWHSGETVGFRNVIVRYPQRRLTVIMLTNRNEPEPYSIALEIARLYLQ